MKIKIDENLPDEVAELFASRGHDVHTVASESLTGADDHAILAAARNEGRVLFTQDLDFSDVRKLKPGTHPGIVLIRLRHPSRRLLLERIRQVFDSVEVESFEQCFVVISEHKLRVRTP